MGGLDARRSLGAARARRKVPEPPDADGRTRNGHPRDGAADPAADPESGARTICLNLLTTRSRSRAELAAELARRDVPDATAVAVFDRLAEVGLLDDAAFAEQWISSRHRHRGLGRRALADELRRKGVDRATAGAALDDLSRDDERARAEELVRRRLPSLERVDATVAARRLVGMLARKGYDAGLVYEVVRAVLAEAGDEFTPDPDADDPPPPDQDRGE